MLIVGSYFYLCNNVVLFEKCVFRHIVFVPVGDVLSIVCNFLFHVIILLLLLLLLCVIMCYVIMYYYYYYYFVLSIVCNFYFTLYYYYYYYHHHHHHRRRHLDHHYRFHQCDGVFLILCRQVNN